MVKSTLEGAVQQIKRELKNDVDRFFDNKSGDVLVRKGRRFVRAILNRLENAKIKEFPVDITEIVGQFCAEDIVDPDTGEILVNFNETITNEILNTLKEKKIKSIFALLAAGKMSDSWPWLSCDQ